MTKITSLATALVLLAAPALASPFDPAHTSRDAYVDMLAAKGRVGTGGPVTTYDPSKTSRDRALAALGARGSAVATHGRMTVRVPTLDPFSYSHD
ncbi:hypothetical protein [Chthonobacter rhizosphaerae]|uniref:hypothetical protein n=1 Tax=Chthonobacter rhizosphaerae TaxID=2735553 RepID=UPI0015EF6E61|nr:hypothetical protein [Chthonobacter rhizosphaerae]